MLARRRGPRAVAAAQTRAEALALVVAAITIAAAHPRHSADAFLTAAPCADPAQTSTVCSAGQQAWRPRYGNVAAAAGQRVGNATLDDVVHGNDALFLQTHDLGSRVTRAQMPELCTFATDNATTRPASRSCGSTCGAYQMIPSWDLVLFTCVDAGPGGDGATSLFAGTLVDTAADDSDEAAAPGSADGASADASSGVDWTLLTGTGGARVSNAKEAFRSPPVPMPANAPQLVPPRAFDFLAFSTGKVFDFDQRDQNREAAAVGGRLLAVAIVSRNAGSPSGRRRGTLTAEDVTILDLSAAQSAGFEAGENTTSVCSSNSEGRANSFSVRSDSWDGELHCYDTSRYGVDGLGVAPAEAAAWAPRGSESVSDAAGDDAGSEGGAAANPDDAVWDGGGAATPLRAPVQPQFSLAVLTGELSSDDTHLLVAPVGGHQLFYFTVYRPTASAGRRNPPQCIGNLPTAEERIYLSPEDRPTGGTYYFEPAAIDLAAEPYDMRNILSIAGRQPILLDEEDLEDDDGEVIGNEADTGRQVLITGRDSVFLATIPLVAECRPFAELIADDGATTKIFDIYVYLASLRNRFGEEAPFPAPGVCIDEDGVSGCVVRTWLGGAAIDADGLTTMNLPVQNVVQRIDGLLAADEFPASGHSAVWRIGADSFRIATTAGRVLRVDLEDMAYECPQYFDEDRDCAAPVPLDPELDLEATDTTAHDGAAVGQFLYVEEPWYRFPLATTALVVGLVVLVCGCAGLGCAYSMQSESCCERDNRAKTAKAAARLVMHMLGLVVALVTFGASCVGLAELIAESGDLSKVIVGIAGSSAAGRALTVTGGFANSSLWLSSRGCDRDTQPWLSSDVGCISNLDDGAEQVGSECFEEGEGLAGADPDAPDTQWFAALQGILLSIEALHICFLLGLTPDKYSALWNHDDKDVMVAPRTRSVVRCGKFVCEGVFTLIMVAGAAAQFSSLPSSALDVDGDATAVCSMFNDGYTRDGACVAAMYLRLGTEAPGTCACPLVNREFRDATPKQRSDVGCDALWWDAVETVASQPAQVQGADSSLSGRLRLDSPCLPWNKQAGCTAEERENLGDVTNYASLQPSAAVHVEEYGKYLAPWSAAFVRQPGVYECDLVPVCRSPFTYIPSVNNGFRWDYHSSGCRGALPVEDEPVETRTYVVRACVVAVDVEPTTKANVLSGVHRVETLFQRLINLDIVETILDVGVWGAEFLLVVATALCCCHDEGDWEHLGLPCVGNGQTGWVASKVGKARTAAASTGRAGRAAAPDIQMSTITRNARRGRG